MRTNGVEKGMRGRGVFEKRLFHVGGLEAVEGGIVGVRDGCFVY